MLTLPQTKMTFVCGPVASGKTHLIKTWLERDNRHVIFDSTGEYSNPDNEEIWGRPRELNDRIEESQYYFRFVYVPGIDREEDFEHVLNILWWKQTTKLLVCDEVADLCPVSGTTRSMEMLLRFARKDKLGFLAASQRIADVSKLFTGGCRMVVLFQTHEARDLEAIDNRWKCADLVENLRPLLYDDDTETTQQIPQCVVIEKGKKPYVYDFQTESVAKVGESVQGIEEDASGVEDTDDLAHEASERDAASAEPEPEGN